jgi:hypothetical protein
MQPRLGSILTRMVSYDAARLRINISCLVTLTVKVAEKYELSHKYSPWQCDQCVIKMNLQQLTLDLFLNLSKLKNPVYINFRPQIHMYLCI